MTYPHFDFYTELYFKELERGDTITGNLNTPAGWLAGLAGGLAYLWGNVLADVPSETWALWGAVLASACWAISLAYILRTYYFHDWAYLPQAVETAGYEAAVLEHYHEYEQPIEEAQVYFERQIVKELSVATDQNFLINHNRIIQVRKATMWLAASVLLTAIASGLEIALG